MWDLVPWAGVDPGPLHWEHRIPADRLPGKSLTSPVFCSPQLRSCIACARIWISSFTGFAWFLSCVMYNGSIQSHQSIFFLMLNCGVQALVFECLPFLPENSVPWLRTLVGGDGPPAHSLEPFCINLQRPLNSYRDLECTSAHIREDMATHSSIFAWRILWTEEPGVPQSMVSQ